jgi:hypothetical protein
MPHQNRTWPAAGSGIQTVTADIAAALAEVLSVMPISSEEPKREDYGR